MSLSEVFQQKLYNELHDLRDLFFAKYFLLFRYIAYSPRVFYYKKESLNTASSYQKDSKILISVAAIITQLREK